MCAGLESWAQMTRKMNRVNLGIRMASEERES